MNGERYSVDAEAMRRIRSETPQVNPQEVTQLLADWSHGDHAALEKLTPLVYEELHRLAHHYMLSWRSQWKISIGNSISKPRGTNRNVPVETCALCNAANFAEPSVASVDMKYFRKRSACSTMARSSG